MNWQAFSESAPVLARLGRERFERTGLVMLGTNRKNGYPRITPIEWSLFEGELLLGGMWQSKKMLDLVRDPRCVLHSTTSDKNGTEGDFKLYGEARDCPDPEFRERYGQHIFEQIGWRPEEPYHLFAVDIREAALLQFGEATAAMAEQVQRDPAVRAEVHHDDPAGPGHLVAHWKA
ncbi:MAG: pyridoxamine 5'-phosphate oxidase family protein [Hyphomicrobiales bacterium]